MNSAESPELKPSVRLRPWRWEWLGWLLAIVFLAIGLPLFYRMPPWCDLTLYDLAARAIMTGGVHYRDVFDTNLPGFVWTLVLVRRGFGPSTEAVRLVDLAIVFSCVALLFRLAKRAGADGTALAWFAAGTAIFYPFATEFCHAQRDVWMLLPSLLALTLRLREPRNRPFLTGLLEGVLWGVAVWFKPHVLFPAAGVWLVTARRLTPDRRWRSTRDDFLGNLLGGSLVGALGIVWLVRTGTWPYFVEIFAKWNPHYTEYLFAEIGWRAVSHPFHFAPWTYLQPLVAFLCIADIATAGSRRWPDRLPRWLYVPSSDDRARAVRYAIGALYLAWLLQSFLLQRQFPYVHVPSTLIAFAILAAHRWAAVPFGLAFFALALGFHLLCDFSPAVMKRAERVERSFEWFWHAVPRHPITAPARLHEWPGCWDELHGTEYRQRQDRLGSYSGYFAGITFDEAHEMAAWLRERGATAGDVICWHSSPHAVYLDLPGTPGFRFMHVDTPLIRRATYEYLKEELIRDAVPRAKYVVIDLCRSFVNAPPDLASEWHRREPPLPPLAITVFPYSGPVVFRSGNGRGRYVVRELKKPVDVTEYDLPKGNIWGRE